MIVGRAVTAQFLSHRPDYDAVVVAGAREGHLEGDRQNSWVIETLESGDMMVVDIVELTAGRGASPTAEQTERDERCG